jgi:hypothetical protein
VIPNRRNSRTVATADSGRITSPRQVAISETSKLDPFLPARGTERNVLDGLAVVNEDPDYGAEEEARGG